MDWVTALSSALPGCSRSFVFHQATYHLLTMKIHHVSLFAAAISTISVLSAPAELDERQLRKFTIDGIPDASFTDIPSQLRSSSQCGLCGCCKCQCCYPRASAGTRHFSRHVINHGHSHRCIHHISGHVHGSSIDRHASDNCYDVSIYAAFLNARRPWLDHPICSG